MRHIEWSKVVDAHGDLKILLGPIIRRNENACVVDQDVQRRTAVKKPI